MTSLSVSSLLLRSTTFVALCALANLTLRSAQVEQMVPPEKDGKTALATDADDNRPTDSAAAGDDDRAAPLPKTSTRVVRPVAAKKGNRTQAATEVPGDAPVGFGQVEQPVSLAKDGKLIYTTDIKGNRVPDFSVAGYGGGGVVLPHAPARVIVGPVAGDNGERIQAALDFVAGLPLDSATGLRGAVLLEKGRYEIAGQLKLNASGVVLRGAGPGKDGTLLVATGTERRPLIDLRGKRDSAILGKPFSVSTPYVPVGATKFKVESAASLHVGDRVRVRRPSPEAWIKQIGMSVAPARSGFFWHANTMDIVWDRRVAAVSNDEVTLDAPLTTALDATLGGGAVEVYRWPGLIQNVGVERLRCESVYDTANPKDEQHSWTAINLDSVEDAWVREVVAAHFSLSAVYLDVGASRVTVEDCLSIEPVSELAGYRRHTFFTAGQQTLFLRCRADNGQHDFVTGYLTAGPNVFLECTATNPHGFSGSIGSWASGILFDHMLIDGGELRLDNLETWNQGVGWSAANSVIWQSKAGRFICRTPPGAANWASGVWGMFVGSGIWSKSSEFVNPDSLYRAQLVERLGKQADGILATMKAPPEKTDAPHFEQAVTNFAEFHAHAHPAPAQGMVFQHGWLTSEGKILIGTSSEVSWWRGQLAPQRAADEGPSITRFAPGRTGLGLTDDLDMLTTEMKTANHVALRHHWGLWYDRRSDDHQMVRRPDADVWPPFFDQPWLRSGQGEAWDRLSRYDLSKYNPWYFGRLHAFAEYGRAKGVVLVSEMYFQHNILEAGAHWASFPWRPANCLQDTGFPEPPPYVEDKRNFMAETFYDLSSPVRRELNRSLIRHYLDALSDEPNIIHTTGAEFTGPLSFLQFWVDTASEWVKETGRHPLLALSASKEEQDAILADPVRSSVVSVIDFTYWWNTNKGLFAPKSGENLSPRQSERQWHGGKPDPTSLARMVREYRERFPEKAIITSLGEGDGWAFVAAGGSLPSLPASTDPKLLAAFPHMYPVHGDAKAKGWILSEPGQQYFVYADAGTSVTLDLKAEQGVFQLHRINLKTGALVGDAESVKAGALAELSTTAGKANAFWLTR